MTISGLKADSEDDEFPVGNLSNPSTALLWKSLTTDEQYIAATLNENDPIDYVGFARHNFGTANIAVSIEGAVDLDSNGDPEWKELTQEVIPADDAPLIFRFKPQSLIAVRVRMQGGDAMRNKGQGRVALTRRLRSPLAEKRRSRRTLIWNVQ